MPKPSLLLYRICAGLSVFSLLLLLYEFIATFTNLPTLEGWVHGLSFLLISGSIGFVTNWLAIKMMFHPREPRPWLFFWKQGMLPREQARFARALADVAANQLLHPDTLIESLKNQEIRETLGNTIRTEIEYVLEAPATRELVIDAIEDSIRIHGSEFLHHVRPNLRKVIEEFFESVLTTDQLMRWLETGLLKFAESRSFRRALAKWITRETAQDGSMQRIMALMKEQFYQYREKHPVRGFFAEQFVLDWDQLRRSMVETLKSAEATEEVAHALIQASGSIIERLQEEEALESLQRFRSALIDRTLDWFENDGYEVFAKKLHQFSREPEFWNLIGSSVDELLSRAPNAIFDAETGEMKTAVAKGFEDVQHRIVSAFPIADLVENQINLMEPAELETMINRISEKELAAIQILGFFVGAVFGVLLYFIR